MINESKKVNTWWIFYPMKGLDISDKQPNLRKPLFEDATIVSKSHVHQIISLLKTKDRNINDMKFIMSHDIKKEAFQSFVAVCRTGNVPHKDHNPKILRDASKRAYQISSLLTLIFLAQSKTGKTCGLLEQLHDQTQCLTMINFHNKAFRYQMGGGLSHTIIEPQKTLIISSAALRKMLFQKQFLPLSNSLLHKNSSLPKSLHKAIVHSAVRLSDSVHAVTPSAQLLGAVTSIEILIAEQGDKYEVIENRLIALLGQEANTLYDAKSVLKARHLYVHKGEEVERQDIPLKSIALALTCLLRYAESAPFFTDKITFAKYLDFLFSAGGLSDNWSSTEQNAFDKLLRHKREIHKFPFFINRK